MIKNILIITLSCLISFVSYGDSTVIIEMLTPSFEESVDINNDLNKQYAGCSIIEVETSVLSKTCNAKATPQLRNLFKTYYSTLSSSEKKKQKYKLAKLMGMMIKESSGNPSAVADMKGRGSSTSYLSFFKLNKSSGILSRPHYSNTKFLETLLNQKGITIDKQTNFGLAQLSADRLVIPQWGGDYLKEKAADIKKVKASNFSNWCLTKSMYADSDTDLHSYFNENIKNCSMSSKSENGIKCFARTINFCPRMTIELGLKQPMRYFETKKAKPLCSELFE